MPHQCKNHIDHLAHRRCFRCREYICSECASLTFQHYFCGAICKTAYFLGNFHTLLWQAAEPFASRWLRSYGEGRIGKVRFITLDRIALLAILLVNLSLFALLSNRVTRLNLKLDSIEDGIAEMRNAMETNLKNNFSKSQFTVPALDPLSDTINYTGFVTLTGKADDSFVLVLTVNGAVRASENAESGKFVFDDVELQPGTNDISLTALLPDNTLLRVDDLILTYRTFSADDPPLNIRRGALSNPAIALTFDGSWTDRGTVQILNILRDKGVRSTMFLSRIFLQKYPEITARIAADGHEVGNHTYSHSHLTTYEENLRHETLPGITPEIIKRELTSTDSLYRAITGLNMIKYWRAPFGEHNGQLRFWAEEAGYRHISWTVGGDPNESMDTHDWVTDLSSELYKTPSEIMDALLHFGDGDDFGANGAIILMHLGTNRERDFLYESLPSIIDLFREKGYTLLTISELLGEVENSPVK